MLATKTYLDSVPGEEFLISCLQKQITLCVNNKTIKKGRLLLFKRTHYFIQLSLETNRNSRENVDVPIPFATEFYEEEGLMYFDYRLESLNVKCLPKIPEKVTSVYFNNILELQVN